MQLAAHHVNTSSFCLTFNFLIGLDQLELFKVNYLVGIQQNRIITRHLLYLIPSKKIQKHRSEDRSDIEVTGINAKRQEIHLHIRHVNVARKSELHEKLK